MTDPKIETPTKYRVDTCAPASLSAAEMERCLTIVVNGGAIENPDRSKKWLPRSVILAVVRKGNEIVGVGAIKPGRSRYAAGVAEKAGHAIHADAAEIGYIARDPAYRNNRFSPHIVAALLGRQAGPLWATTSSAAVRAALSDAGFRRCGNEWGERDNPLSLWLKA